MLRGVRRNALVKASERNPNGYLELFSVKFAHTLECGWLRLSRACVAGEPSVWIPNHFKWKTTKGSNV
jgi:hypothetical protein